MAVTVSEAAEAKSLSRNAVWKAIRRNELTARKTSGGIWLIEEDEKWTDYQPRKYMDRRGGPRPAEEEE